MKPLVCMSKLLGKLSIILYEGEKPWTVMSSVALLFQKIYSSYWGHMNALGALLKWGYGSLDSTKKSLNDRPKCEGHFIDPRATQKYA